MLKAKVVQGYNLQISIWFGKIQGDSQKYRANQTSIFLNEISCILLYLPNNTTLEIENKYGDNIDIYCEPHLERNTNEIDKFIYCFANYAVLLKKMRLLY